MKSFWPLVRYAVPHWRGLLVVAVTMALSVGLDVLRPWPMKELVDNVLGEERLNDLAGAPLTSFPGGTKGLLLSVCIATVIVFAARASVGMVNAAASVTLRP